MSPKEGHIEMSVTIRSPRPARSGRAPIAWAIGLLALASLASVKVSAASGWLEPSPPQLAPQHLFSPPGVSLEQATETVRRYTGGRVLSASPAQRAGARGYEVRVLVDGKRVRNVFVDNEGRIRSRD